jgi:hypothetical protein
MIEDETPDHNSAKIKSLSRKKNGHGLITREFSLKEN